MHEQNGTTATTDDHSQFLEMLVVPAAARSGDQQVNRVIASELGDFGPGLAPSDQQLEIHVCRRRTQGHHAVKKLIGPGRPLVLGLVDVPWCRQTTGFARLR
jgi:hypothetical protein